MSGVVGVDPGQIFAKNGMENTQRQDGGLFGVFVSVTLEIISSTDWYLIMRFMTDESLIFFDMFTAV